MKRVHSASAIWKCPWCDRNNDCRANTCGRPGCGATLEADDGPDGRLYGKFTNDLATATADPKAPEMPDDNDKFIRFVGCPRSPVPLAEIRHKLFRFYGLHIVSDAERKVLACMADADIEIVGGRNRQRRQFMFELQEDAVCTAELARRIGTT